MSEYRKRVVYCKECGMAAKIQSISPIPILIKYCPECGYNKVTVWEDTRETYFEIVGKLFGLPSFVVRQLYSEWNPSVHSSFYTFIQEMIDNAETKSISGSR